MKRLAILGSTGSIGQSALSLVDMFPDRFKVVSLAANARAELLCQQAIKYRPEMVALYDQSSGRELAERLPGIRVATGEAGVIEAAVHEGVDAVMSAISGAAGLIPTWNAILAGKDIALANIALAAEFPRLHQRGFGCDGNKCVYFRLELRNPFQKKACELNGRERFAPDQPPEIPGRAAAS